MVPGLFQPPPHAVPLTVLNSQPCLHLSIESYSWPHCLSSLSYTPQPNCPNTCPSQGKTIIPHCSSPCPPTPVLLPWSASHAHELGQGVAPQPSAPALPVQLSQALRQTSHPSAQSQQLTPAKASCHLAHVRAQPLSAAISWVGGSYTGGCAQFHFLSCLYFQLCAHQVFPSKMGKCNFPSQRGKHGGGGKLGFQPI